MVVNRAARALVALESRTEVTLEDVAKVIALCLNHRCASRAGKSNSHVVLCLKDRCTPPMYAVVDQSGCLLAVLAVPRLS